MPSNTGSTGLWNISESLTLQSKFISFLATFSQVSYVFFNLRQIILKQKEVNQDYLHSKEQEKLQTD